MPGRLAEEPLQFKGIHLRQFCRGTTSLLCCVPGF